MSIKRKSRKGIKDIGINFTLGLYVVWSVDQQHQLPQRLSWKFRISTPTVELMIGNLPFDDLQVIYKSIKDEEVLT